MDSGKCVIIVVLFLHQLYPFFHWYDWSGFNTDQLKWIMTQMNKWLSNDTPRECDQWGKTTDEVTVQEIFWSHGLTLEMKGMCILVYGLMSLISTWVLMFRRSSATQRHMISYKKHIYYVCGLKSRSPLTLYVLSNEGVVHYVTVICFQDFLKFSDVIVLVGAGRKKQSSVVILYTLCLCDPHTNSVKHIPKY